MGPVIFLSLWLLSVAPSEAAPRAFRCDAYCYFMNSRGAYERLELSRSAATRAKAWSSLRSACKKRKLGQLQLSNSKFTTCKDGDSPAACAEPEFFAAKEVGACVESK